MPSRIWTRRDFLGVAGGSGLLLAGGPRLEIPGWLAQFLAAPGSRAGAAGGLAGLVARAPRARFWVSAATAETPADCRMCHDDGKLPEAAAADHGKLVLCRLCARNCRIEPGERGMCRARYNAGGELRSLVYGRPITVHVDPIEKKPFYHFLPGSQAFSLATSGCPLRCKFCQNWEISQALPEDYDGGTATPAHVVSAAGARRTPVIAFTYNEPTVFTEYLLDIARAARENGTRTALVSCGFMNEAPLTEMCDALDAIKIDLKGFSDPFYRSICSAELKPVLRSIKQVAKGRPHLELVNLVVPTLNDSPAMLRDLAKWVHGEIGPDVPVHFTRFHPDYQLPNLPPTPVATLERAREIALEEGLHYPFVGNVPGHPGNNSYCPKCGKAVIERKGFFVTGKHFADGRCTSCETTIAGVWNEP